MFLETWYWTKYFIKSLSDAEEEKEISVLYPYLLLLFCLLIIR